MRKIHVMWVALVAAPLMICSCMPTTKTTTNTMCCVDAKHAILIAAGGLEFASGPAKGDDATHIEVMVGDTICWQNSTSGTLVLTFARRHGPPSRVFTRDRVRLRPGECSGRVRIRGGLMPRLECYQIEAVPAADDPDNVGTDPDRRIPTVKVGG